MSDRTKRIIVGASLLAAGVVGTLIFLKLRLADDENPIRVRNKILNFESEGSQTEWAADGSSRWRLKKNKHPSNVFEVNAFGSSNCVTAVSGISVQVVFQQDDGTTRTFTITTDTEANPGQNPKREPVIELANADDLDSDNAGYKKKLRIKNDPQGHITQIIVRPQSGDPVTCNFPAEPRVLVELCRGQCS
jgi:polyisoprenoid-binding protein YceI